MSSIEKVTIATNIGHHNTDDKFYFAEVHLDGDGAYVQFRDNDQSPTGFVGEVDIFKIASAMLSIKFGLEEDIYLLDNLIIELLGK